MLCFGVFGTCRSGFGVLFLVILVLITVGCDTLGGSGVVMVSLPGPASLRLRTFLNELLVLIGYPDGSAAALLAGDLPLRYCNTRFAWKLPTWRLPDRGRVRDLVADSVDDARFLGRDRLGGDSFPPPVGRAGDSFDDRVLGGVKRIRLNRKHQHTLQDLGTLRVFSLVPGFGRDFGFLGLIGVQFVILMCCMSVIMMAMGLLWMTGLGLDSLRLHWPTSPGFA